MHEENSFDSDFLYMYGTTGLENGDSDSGSKNLSAGTTCKKVEAAEIEKSLYQQYSVIARFNFSKRDFYNQISLLHNYWLPQF